jgi:excisionase family DNA binding protein
MRDARSQLVHPEQTAAADHAALPAYLSYEELSAATGISTSTLRRRVRDGQLPFFQPGGHRTRVVFPADVVERLLQMSTKPSTPSSELQPPPPTVIQYGPRPKWLRET